METSAVFVLKGSYNHARRLHTRNMGVSHGGFWLNVWTLCSRRHIGSHNGDKVSILQILQSPFYNSRKYLSFTSRYFDISSPLFYKVC